jgi:hypothetical protein
VLSVGHDRFSAMVFRERYRLQRPSRITHLKEIAVDRRKAFFRQVATVALIVLSLSSSIVYADDKPYTEGSVWSLSMIRVKPGMADVYFRDILPLRKKMNEEAQKQGLLLSSHVLSGSAYGKEDFDVLFLDEYKNWAAFDGINAKYDAIMSRIIGPEDKQVQVMTKRTEVREILGDKVMQELLIK